MSKHSAYLKDQDQIRAMLSLSSQDLGNFAITMMNNYEPNWHHEVICKRLQQVAEGKIKRLMIFMPPRHGKSQLASIFFPAWYLGRNPYKEIMACSYNDQMAEEFGRKARNIFKDEKFKLMFPNAQLSQDSKRINRWSTTVGGGYVAAGVGGPITGRGADVLLIDDPIKNKEDAESETMRAKTWDWYTSTAYTRLHPGGSVVLILTRWHDDDLAGRILETEKDLWKIVKFPAISTNPERYRGKGQPLWPQKYPLEELKAIRKTIGSGNFASLYQQDPILSETQEFKETWFKTWDKLPPKLRVMTTVDPAISQKKRADSSVVMTCGMDPQGQIYLLEYTNKKLNPTELISEIFKHKLTWKSEKVGIETIAYQQALVHFMKAEMKKRGQFINIKEINTRSNKESRIRGLIPYYQNGAIWHCKDSEDLENELKRFPSGRHDDIVDALSMQLSLLAKPGAELNRKGVGIRYDPRTGQVLGNYGDFNS